MINPKKIIFYLCFIFLFCIGGLITLLGVPFRMAYVSFLPLSLIPLYGIRITKSLFVIVLFSIAVLLSAIYNRSSIGELLSFLRFIVIPFAMYYIVTSYVTSKNIQKIIKLCVYVAILQPPLILLQKLFYSKIVQLSGLSIMKVDIGFGSFYIADDPAMSFFVIGMILFLLFDRRNNYFLKMRIPIALWISSAILMANSILLTIVTLAIWLAFLVIKMLSRNFILAVSLFSIFSVGAITVLSTSYSDQVQEKLIYLKGVISPENASADLFLEGRYSRSYAVIYYINQPLKLLGDGPSKYYNPLTREYKVGNTGQIFTFYSEIGLLGLVLGYILLFQMTRTSRSSMIVALPYCITLALLSTTTSIFSDASIMFAYVLFLNTNLVSAQLMPVSKNARNNVVPSYYMESYSA